ncbi:hypothetical protein CBS101457_006785 [Exobasidium rhododendri]|nr:hypothetical protein CBS101457_006785 [Exobasidium rhododendri]
MRAFPSHPIADSSSSIPPIVNDSSIPALSPQGFPTSPPHSSGLLRPIDPPSSTVVGSKGQTLHQNQSKQPIEPLQFAAQLASTSYSPHFQHLHSSVGHELPNQAVYSSSPRRNRSHDQHQQASRLQEQQQILPPFSLQQQLQHQTQSQGSANFASEPNLLHQHPQPINLSDHRPLSSFGVPLTAYPSTQGGTGGSNEGAQVMQMPASFAQQSQLQIGDYSGNQTFSEASHSNSFSQFPDYRLQDRMGNQSEMSLSSRSASEWNSLPDMRSRMRGMHGHFLTPSTSAHASSSEDGAKGGHQSRTKLRRHLRDLQAEMVDLKERVRVAGNLYQNSAPTGDSSPRQNNSSFDRKVQGDYRILEDARMDERTTSLHHDASSMGGNSSNYVNDDTFASPYASFPLSRTNWRQGGYTPSTQVGSSSTAESSVSGRRGTWRTGENGNVLIFKNATSTDMDSSASDSNAGQGQRRGVGDGVGHSESTTLEDEEGDSDVGEESSRRYECLVSGCLKTFTTSGHARRHSRTHLGHKLFVCPHKGCRSTFTRRDNCRQHQRTRHHSTLPIGESTENETLESLAVD